jgi:hypothetical protein
MDIIKLIKAQQKIYELDIDSNAKSLAMLFTVKANQFGRGDDEFYLTDKDIKTFLGFSLKTNHTLINARKVLIDKGMINYTKGKKGVKSTYKVNWDKIINQ